MNLYFVTRNDDFCYGSCDALIVAAESEADALEIQPQSVGTTLSGSEWTRPENLALTLIGVAAPSVKRGVILASYVGD